MMKLLMNLKLSKKILIAPVGVIVFLHNFRDCVLSESVVL